MRNSRHSIEAPNLEAENRMLRQSLDALTAEARYNQDTFERFNERELALLSAEDLPQLLHILTDGMRESFRLPCVSLVLLDADHELRHLLLNNGVAPEGLHNVQFVDDLQTYNPIYANLPRPWLGPVHGEEQVRLFPGCHLLRSLALLPMIRRNALVGSLNLGSGDPTRFTRHHASDFLHRLATIGAVCLENAANREHLVISGLTDALTGLHNRRYLQRRLEEEVARAERYRQHLSCLFIDADHFKRVNDLHGHAAGDRVLREIALRVKECLRASDVATRFGGEEFAVLLPQTGAGEACSLADRIRRRIKEHPIPLDGLPPLEVSVSIGVSELASQAPDNPGGKLLDNADKALYRAKENGRNRVVLYA